MTTEKVTIRKIDKRLGYDESDSEEYDLTGNNFRIENIAGFDCVLVISNDETGSVMLVEYFEDGTIKTHEIFQDSPQHVATYLHTNQHSNIQKFITLVINPEDKK